MKKGILSRLGFMTHAEKTELEAQIEELKVCLEKQDALIGNLQQEIISHREENNRQLVVTRNNQQEKFTALTNDLHIKTKEFIDAIHLAKQEGIQELGNATQISQQEIIAKINSVQAKQQEQSKMLEDMCESQASTQMALNDMKCKLSTLETSVTTLRHDIEANENNVVDRQEKMHFMLQQLMGKIDGQEKGISQIGDDIVRARAELQKDLSVNEELLRLSVTNQLMDSVEG